LRAKGFSLGGEQSGHLILPAYATTGDGVLTGLHLMARMAATGRTLADLAGVMTKLPQVLTNVTVTDKRAAGEAPNVVAAVAAAQAELGTSGRVLLRPSGTEPMVRVMVEAATIRPGGRGRRPHRGRGPGGQSGLTPLWTVAGRPR
jgi:phosphoglucosamine mutase